MNKFKSKNLLGLILTVCLISFANISIAKEVKIAIGKSFAPYVLKNRNKGMEIEIVQEALASVNHSVKLVYFNILRNNQALFKKDVDAVMTASHLWKVPKFYFSNPHVTHKNVFVTLKDKKIKVDSIGSLKGRKVVAYKHAAKELGDKYTADIASNKRYFETADVSTQIDYLYKNDADAILVDLNKFYYIINTVQSTYKLDKFEIHDIFPEVPYQVAFKSKKLRNDFNKGLVKIKQNGRYQMIIDKYLKIN